MLKVCVSCSVEKPTSEFRKDRTRLGGYQSYCKVCARAYYKSAYMTKYKDAKRLQDQSTRRNNIANIAEYKAAHPCICCGEAESICLDFHHVDEQVKDFALSSGKQRNWEKIYAEIQKCVVVCANCHRKIHAGIITIDMRL